jgi:hypothetical protein
MSKIGLSSNTSGTATFTIASPATNTNRTLTLPDAAGTLNVSGLANEVPAGSAASPSIYPTGDNNTGIFFPAADTIAFAEGGAEVVRIDSSGNVGIGTSSPTNTLTVSAGAGNGIFVEDNNNAGNSPFVKVRGNRSDGNDSQSFSGKLLLEGYQTNAAVVSNKSLGTIAFGGNHTDGSAANILYPASISGVAEGTFSNATTMPTGLAFYTGSTGRTDTTPNVTLGTERARIDSSGNLLIAATTTPPSTGFVFFPTGSTGQPLFNTYRTVDGSVQAYVRSGVGVGSIGVSATATAFNTTSDYRLKENVQPMQDALDTISQLNPVTYTWKVNGSDGQGFIAHELQAVVPDCVTGDKDAVDAEGNPQYQGVDTSFLVAILVKAIQEQQAMIQDLQADIAALKLNT